MACSNCTGACKSTCAGGCNKSCNTGCQSSSKQYNYKAAGSCNGTCYAQCGGSCSGDAAKSAVDGNYNDRYGSNKNGCWCGSDCAGCGGCSGGCSGCTGGCSGCSSFCGGSCSGTCSNGCSYTCSGSCKGYCKGTCSDGCQGSCKTACSGECAHLCNTGCRSNVAVEAFQHLNKYNQSFNKNYTFDEHQLDSDSTILDWLDKEDINHLFGMIQEEGRRRVLKKTGEYTKGEPEENTIAQILTRAEEQQIGLRDERGYSIEVKHGDFADDEKHIKRLVNMFANNTGKSISLSVGGTVISEGKEIRKSIGKTLIEKSLNCYNETIPVNTTSEESGQQSI